MTEPKKRGGVRPGAGPKCKSPTGKPMKTRAMRWSDEDWADARLVGMDRVRELVREEAQFVRSIRAMGKAVK